MPERKGADCLLSSSAKAESSLGFRDQACPKQNGEKKIRFCTMASVASFSRGMMLSPVGLVVCCFWEGNGPRPASAR